MNAVFKTCCVTPASFTTAVPASFSSSVITPVMAGATASNISMRTSKSLLLPASSDARIVNVYWLVAPSVPSYTFTALANFSAPPSVMLKAAESSSPEATIVYVTALSSVAVKLWIASFSAWFSATLNTAPSNVVVPLPSTSVTKTGAWIRGSTSSVTDTVISFVELSPPASVALTVTV